MINSDLFLENNGFFTKVMQIYSYFINQGYISWKSVLMMHF